MPNLASINQVTSIIEHQLDLLGAKPELASVLPPVMLWGPPGVGKSSVIREICNRRGIGFLDIRLAQREPVDLRGLPVPEMDKNQVRWLLASEWPRDAESKGIILFDELTAADRTLQVAAYEFILDRRLGDSYSVPNGWLICAAGNRAEDKAVSMTLSSALANRFAHLELQPDSRQWAAWATTKGLDPDVIAFIRFRESCFFNMTGDLQRGWPSPRGWERVAHLCTHQGALDASAFAILVSGIVGEAAGVEFVAFRRNSKTLPAIDKLLLGELVFQMPDSADRCYAITSGLSGGVFRGPESERGMRITNFLRISLEMTSDFAAMAMNDLINRIPDPDPHQWGEMLFAHPLYTQWTTTHGAVFNA